MVVASDKVSEVLAPQWGGNAVKLYFDDLEVGRVFRGDECVADRDEMLEYARKNDPSPFHVDEDAARNSPYGGLIASAGIR